MKTLCFYILVKAYYQTINKMITENLNKLIVAFRQLKQRSEHTETVCTNCSKKFDWQAKNKDIVVKIVVMIGLTVPRIERFRKCDNWRQLWLYKYDLETKRKSGEWKQPGSPHFKKCARVIFQKWKHASIFMELFIMNMFQHVKLQVNLKLYVEMHSVLVTCEFLAKIITTIDHFPTCLI